MNLLRAAPCAAVIALTLSGCGSLNLQPGWALKRLRMDDVSITDVQGPQERRLRTISRNRTRDQEEAPSEVLAAHFAALKNAEDLYNAGRYAEAEAAYAVVRSQASPKKGFRRGLFNRHQFQDELEQSPVEEDAIFGVAQSQFQQGKLSDAEETYAALLKEYPSTRHLDTVSRQLFRISREWLGFPDADDSELVQVAYGEHPPTLEQRRVQKGSWLPNLKDESRPAYDADGRALAALRLIWLHDAAGPLADDALMMAANYHLRRGDHISAAQHYRLLQEQFPDSPHFKDSLMLGSHVLLASYNGAGYDPSPLEEAKGLKLMALQYPDLAPEDRARLEEELDTIAEAEVEPLWKEIEFYLAKRQPESVLLHCNYLINKYPNSKYARMAAAVREDIVGEKKLAAGWPRTTPPTPRAEADAQAKSLPEAYLDAQDVTRPDGEPAAVDEDQQPVEPRRFLPRFLQRADEPPSLQPVEPQAPMSETTRSDSPAEDVGQAATPEEGEPGRVRLQSPMGRRPWY